MVSMHMLICDLASNAFNGRQRCSKKVSAMEGADLVESLLGDR